MNEPIKIEFVNFLEDKQRLKIFESIKALNLPEPYEAENAILAHMWAICEFDLDCLNMAELSPANQDSHLTIFAYVSNQETANAECFKENGDMYIIISFNLLCKIVLVAKALESIISHRPNLSQTIYYRKDQKQLFDKAIENTLSDYMMNLFRGIQGEDVFGDYDENFDIYSASHLFRLLSDIAPINQSLAIEIADTWVPKYTVSGFGPHMVFYDVIRLTFIHELTHCIHGHLDIIEDKLGLTSLQESNPSSLSNEQENKLIQCMEFEADRVAISVATQQIIKGFDPAIGHFVQEDFELADRYSMLYLSIVIFSASWDIAEKNYRSEVIVRMRDVQKLSNNTHPPAVIRLQNMSDFMFRNMTSWALRHGISALAIKNEQLMNNLHFRMLINSDIWQSEMELIARVYSIQILTLLREFDLFFEHYLPTFDIFKMTSKMRRPYESYVKLVLDDIESLRSECLKHVFVASRNDISFSNDYYYEGFIIQTRGNGRPSYEEMFS